MTKALALCTLTLALVPASAQAAEATFKVSLYGVQRFEQHSHTEPNPDEGRCWNERGDIRQRTTVRFHTTKPVLMRARTSPGYMSLDPVRGPTDLYPFMVRSSWKHDGEHAMEEKDCTDDVDGWKISPPPLPVNCSADIDWMGFGISAFGKGKLEASGGEGVDALNHPAPFDGCPWGDLSMGFYTAKGRIAPSDLMKAREAEVVLRGRTKDRFEGAFGGFTTSEKRTTVYVTFKKVG